MTEKLYYSDGHLANFTAKVLSCTEENGQYAVVLDRTAFFPGGGGQDADEGELGGMRLLGLREDGEEIIPLGDGRLRVSGSVDLDVLGKRLGVELGAEEDCDTLGGLVFSRLAEIPSDGERPVVECLGVRVSVEQILDRRVAWAVVEKLPEAEDSAETARTAPAKQIQTK